VLISLIWNPIGPPLSPERRPCPAVRGTQRAYPENEIGLPSLTSAPNGQLRCKLGRSTSHDAHRSHDRVASGFSGRSGAFPNLK
jgi:hypothetical protein